MLGLEIEASQWACMFFGIFEDIELRAEIGGVVGTADEWAAGYVAEAFFEGDLFVFGKAIGVDVFDDG